MYQYLKTKSSFIKTFTAKDKNYFHVYKNTTNYKMIPKHQLMNKLCKLKQLNYIDYHEL